MALWIWIWIGYHGLDMTHQSFGFNIYSIIVLLFYINGGRCDVIGPYD
jgi:hypothetical protein